MKPVNLTCEHVAGPLAVDTRNPRFSWNNFEERRGARQSAYQLLVSGDRESLRKQVGTEWDSGKVRSADQVAIVYSGKPLSSFTRYYWSVRVWDEAGGAGAASDPAVFETGAFDQREWKADWITRTMVQGGSSDILKVSGAIHKKEDLKSRHLWALYFAKGFVAERKLVRARAFVTGLGYYELHINGTRVGDHLLDPGQTDYNTGALYSAFDLDGIVAPGKNVVRFTIANGRHIDAYGFGNPRGIVQILLEYADGRRTTVGTDTSWLFEYGPVHENGIYLGEMYDARDERKVERLESAALRAVSRASSTNAESAEQAKGVPLRSQLMPPIRATRELQAVSLASPRPGVFVFDFGQNFAGVIRMRVTGPKGDRITLRYAELISPDGNLHVGTNREAPASDSYVLKGEGEEMFQPRFTYHGFRYVEVTGFPGTPTVESLRALVTHTDAPQTGSFACSNPLINRIHENTLWSQRANLMSIPTDCPQRGERMGWLGDAQLASEQAMCNFDMAAFYGKYLEDIRLSQKKDGSLSDVTPAYWPLFPSDPAWATAYVTLAWHMYYSYGDAQILERHYESMKRYVDFLQTSSDRHIIRTLGKYGDWCPPGSVFPKQTPIELTSTWYYYYDTLRFSQIAKVLGRKPDEKVYAKRAAEILEAFNREFLKDEGRYATLQMSPIDYAPGQTSQVLPLFLDMVPKKVRADAVAKLVKTIEDKFDSHVDTGIVGTRYLFEVLRNEGYAELAYRMITQKTYPGWGYMISRGATTIWERWEDLRGLGMNSHNHIMLGTVDAWFYRTLAGITQSAPGWRRATIAPYCLGDLTHASATVGTLFGEISSAWRRSDDDFALDVKVPVGVEATVRIPRSPERRDRARLTESGKRISPTGRGQAGRAAGGAAAGHTAGGVAKSVPKGIVSVKELSGEYVVTVGAGSYHFERKGY